MSLCPIWPAAAYLASHNKAASDKAVFDVRGRSGRIRGRSAALSSDQLVGQTRDSAGIGRKGGREEGQEVVA